MDYLQTIGDRVKIIRAEFAKSQQEMASALGISLRAWQKMERDEGVPSGETLLHFHKVGINSGWVLSGYGQMFTDPSKAPSASRAVDAALLYKLAHLARDVHKEIGSKPHGDTIVTDAADLYNEIITLVSDLNDKEEIEVTLPRLRLLFKRRLQETSGDQEVGRNIA